MNYTPEQEKDIVELVTRIYSRDPKNFRRTMSRFGIDVEPPVYPTKRETPAIITKDMKKTPFESGLKELKDKGAILYYAQKGEALGKNDGICAHVIFAMKKTDIKIFRAPEFWCILKGKNKSKSKFKDQVPAGYEYYEVWFHLKFSPNHPKTKEEVADIIEKRHQKFLYWAANLFLLPKKPRKPNKREKKALIKKMKTMKPPRSERPPRLKNVKKEETKEELP